MLFRRGDTVDLKLGTNEDLTDAIVYVSIIQNGFVVVEKTIGELTIDENSIVVHLSQEDTLQFNSRQKIKIQVRFKKGKVIKGSNILSNTVGEIFKGGVLEDE